jgi:eukaryotic-like serine/threonine-protein kinase
LATETNSVGISRGESPVEGADSSAFASLLRQVARAPVEAELGERVELVPGLVVAERFELVREIGHGGFARVFEARDQVLSRPVAIKLLRRRRLNDSQLAVFYREARATARLNHPNIVTAYDWGAWNDTPFLVLELLDGESLEHQLARGTFGEERAWEIVGQITEALAYAHGLGVLHLDLKTQNVFVLRDGRVKVLDFGLAGLNWTEDIPGRLVRIAGGTPGTMAPEQAEGAATDARTDVWAVGVILHRLLFGRLPEKLAPGADRVAVPAVASRRAARVLGRTLCRNPADRYPDAAALLEELASVQSRQARRTRLLGMLGLPVGTLAGILVISIAVVRGGRDERWLHTEVIPELRRLADSNQVTAAQRLAMRAEAVLPGNEELARVWWTFARPVTVSTEPPGATVYWRDYDDPSAPWEQLGRTPIRMMYPIAARRLRFELDGYHPSEVAPTHAFADPFPLDRLGTIPGDVVHVPGGRAGPGPGHQGLVVPGFLLDRHEVTNRRYKAFVDAGGYRRPELWRHPFLESRRKLSWDEAMRRFTDGTGRPGPSTWRDGTYPPGQEDIPVGGVSWYEAAAYAVFEGRDLPSVFHWRRAAWGPAVSVPIVRASNFANRGPAPVGTFQGMSEFGAFDMAGNVREWTLNEGMGRPDAHYILGGGWDDPTYAYAALAIQPSWDRSLTNGFRLVTYLDPDAGLDAARQPLEGPGAGARDYTRETPAGDADFQIYQRLHAYDPKPLNATLVQSETRPEWIQETITFDAAYRGERMVAHLYLPRVHGPPYQTVVVWLGASALPESEPAATLERRVEYLAFLLRRGRALVIPVYRGTGERPSELRSVYPDSTVAYRDAVIQWTQDLRRTIDYLESREDIDRDKIGFFGLSWGGMLGGLVPAVEPRLRTAVLVVAGLAGARPLPEADPFNFLPRVRIPVLMLNGRYDDYFPVESSQEPMFRLLGTPPEHKRLVVVESAHLPIRERVVQESLSWYDRTLGPTGVPAAPP